MPHGARLRLRTGRKRAKLGQYARQPLSVGGRRGLSRLTCLLTGVTREHDVMSVRLGTYRRCVLRDLLRGAYLYILGNFGTSVYRQSFA